MAVSPKETAVILCDFQNDIIKNFAADEPKLKHVTTTVFSNANAAADAAREAGGVVVHIVVRFREGYPEAHPNNKVFAGINQRGILIEGSEGAAIHSGITVKKTDIVCAKRRFGAFSTTDLHTVLQSRGVKHIVLSGLSTSGVITSTVRDAADRDYAITVLKDGCYDNDLDLHNALMDKLFPRQATVINTADFLKSWGKQ